MLTYAQHSADLLNQFGASFWLKDAIRALDKRDPVDALRDVEILRDLTELRLREIDSK